MFGRPSISRNTDLDQGSVKELLVQADAFMENLNNFADSRRVIEKARMVSQKNPNNELDDNVAELRSVADDLARLMIRLEDSWMDARRSLEEETQVDEAFFKGNLDKRFDEIEIDEHDFRLIGKKARERAETYARMNHDPENEWLSRVLYKYAGALEKHDFKTIRNSLIAGDPKDRRDTVDVTYKVIGRERTKEFMRDLQSMKFSFFEESDLTESRDHVNEIKRHVQRAYKKNDPITYIDSRDHETHTHTFKGIKNMGGRPYAAIETGKELLMVPMYQLVLDI